MVARDEKSYSVLATLTYVSTSRLDPSEAAEALDSIVSRARIRNATDGITGALLFTGRRFVQVLEGSPETIDALMVKICADSRHENLVIADRATLPKRLFADWSLAYAGAAHFINSRVVPLLDESDPIAQRRAALVLIDVMYRFTQET